MTVLVRAFRFGYGRSTQSEMDERIETTSGRCYHLRGKFVDDSLMPMDEWREKHRGYAKREAKMATSGMREPEQARVLPPAAVPARVRVFRLPVLLPPRLPRRPRRLDVALLAGTVVSTDRR